MTEIVRKINPFSSYEIEYMESWLTDMARQGLLLDSIILWFASFRKVEPCNRRYRIIPKSFGFIRDTEKDFYEQQQWYFALSISGLNIFYTDNEDAEELFTDAASFRSYTKKYAAVEILMLITFPFVLYWWFTTNFGSSESPIPPLHLIHEMGLMLTICIGLIFLLAIFYLIRMTIASVLLIIKIKKKTMLAHDKPYLKAAKIYRIISIVTIVTMISLPVSVIVSHNVLGTTVSYAKTLAYDGFHPIMLQEIDQENWALVQKCIDSEEWLGDIDYSIDSYWNGLFKRVVNGEVHINKSEDEWVYYQATFYNARSVSIAQRFFEEEISYAYAKEVTMDTIKFECATVDYAGYYYNAAYSHQCLFLLKGSQIEIVVYNGEKNLRDYLQLFVDDINTADDQN